MEASQREGHEAGGARRRESVWDYPRPPRTERDTRRVTVHHGGALLADSRHALRVLETSHPPVFYLPRADVRVDRLTRSAARTFCEWKGVAVYWSLRAEGPAGPDVAWSYEEPSPGTRISPGTSPSIRDGSTSAPSTASKSGPSRVTSTVAGSPTRSTGPSRAFPAVRGGEPAALAGAGRARTIARRPLGRGRSGAWPRSRGVRRSARSRSRGEVPTWRGQSAAEGRRRSARTSRAARVPEARAPCSEPVARWSPHT